MAIPYPFPIRVFRSCSRCSHFAFFAALVFSILFPSFRVPRYSLRMPLIARVVVDMSLGREFDYRIPAALRDRIHVGSRVRVPFGRTRKEGFVVATADESSHGTLKDILDVRGEHPFLDAGMVALARWMADYYCAPLEAAVRTVLPAAVRRQGASHRETLHVQACGPADAEQAKGLGPKQRAVLELLGLDGDMALSELARRSGATPASIRALAKRGLVGIGPRRRGRRPGAERNVLRTTSLTLMPEQAAALTKIMETLDGLAARAAAGEQAPHARHVVLLHGVTGQRQDGGVPAGHRHVARTRGRAPSCWCPRSR